ncbi:MAG: histidine--tRNA ligase [Gemmatimonadales bacterium]|nr:MAG: histidine--tRNA ligase [Gemmatimonadales bacterium]
MSNAKDFARLPGFRDFPPEELGLRSHLFEAWRRVAARYGFQEYDAPPLEPLSLYVEKSGEEIVGQLYNFTDKGGREVSLRPEMTPSLARVLGDRSRSMPKPIRWFSIPQLFRYERQQRGRLREHFQWNVDLVGAAGPEADAEVLAVALDGLRELGLDAHHIRARVSDRRLLAGILGALGVPESSLLAAYGVVDKIEREPRERILQRLTDEVELPREVAEAVAGLFDAPELDAVEARFGQDPAVAPHLASLRSFLEILGDLGFGEYVDFDLTIVRGLAYYTGVVFEIFDRAGEFRAVAGGGRYDRLLELVGGESLPAVGFGMGDVVLSDLLRERGLAPDTSHSVDHFIVTIGDEQASLARRIAASLRGRGRSVVYGVRGQSVRKQFSAASNEGAREVLVLGPDEVSRGVAVVRSMDSGAEREVRISELLGDAVVGA